MNENPDNGQETIPVPEGFTIQTLEMAMVTKAEFDKWTKDSAILKRIRDALDDTDMVLEVVKDK